MMRIKNIGLLACIVCSLFTTSMHVQGQSFLDALIKEAGGSGSSASAAKGGLGVNMKSLQGTWVYVKPLVMFESGSTLDNLAGAFLATEIEKQLTKAGVVQGELSLLFNTDGSFSNKLKDESAKGKYTVNSKEKTISLKYDDAEKLKIPTLKANVVVSEKQLTLLFPADELLVYLKMFSAVIDDKYLTIINALLSEYDEISLGLELKR